MLAKHFRFTNRVVEADFRLHKCCGWKCSEFTNMVFEEQDAPSLENESSGRSIRIIWLGTFQDSQLLWLEHIEMALWLLEIFRFPKMSFVFNVVRS